MKKRILGDTGIEMPILSFGASSLGAEFRSITLEEAMLSTQTAIELGMNFIDTSPFYGRGMSEILLGIGLKGIPREQYLLGSKLGRYSDIHFDFSAKSLYPAQLGWILSGCNRVIGNTVSPKFLAMIATVS